MAVDRQMFASPTNRAAKSELGSAVQLEWAAVLSDLARAHEDDPVGHRERLALVVCDEHERRPEVTVQPAELLLHRRSHGEVERCQRLVEQQYARLRRQRASERDALRLTTADLRWQAIRQVRQADELEQLLGARAPRMRTYPPYLQPEGDVLEHRQMREQRIALEREAERPRLRRPLGHALVAEVDLAGRRRLEPGDDAEQRGLAAAGRAEEGHELPLLDLEHDIAKRNDAAELLADAIESDGGAGHSG